MPPQKNVNQYMNVKRSLDIWFGQSKTPDKTIHVYSDLIDDESDEPIRFLSIRQTETGLYEVNFEDEEPDTWALLNQDSLNDDHVSIALIAADMNKRYERYNKRVKTVVAVLLSIAAAVLVGGIIASAIVSGGTSLVGIAAIVGLSVGSGVGAGLTSWFGYKAFKALTQWIAARFQERPDQEGTYNYQTLPKTWPQRLFAPLEWINAGLKWLVRTFIFDSFISKFVLGNAIAAVANHGNPHYKTEANTLTKALGTIIYPAGLQSAKIEEDGHIYLGPVLGKHHRYLRDFNPGDRIFAFKPFKVQMKNDTLLDGIEASNGLAADQNALNLIYFNGNTGCYEENNHLIHRDLEAFRERNVAVKAIQFNYPGVLKSTGRVVYAEDLVQAGIAQVERLNKLHDVPYHNIGLHGVSLGGSLVSHVASYYHARGIELAGTYASKTFSSTTNVAVSYMHKIPVVGHVLGFILRPFIVIGLWATRWQMDTAANFASLPEDKRDYSVIRSDKLARRHHEPKDDLVLTHYASLHESWHLRLSRFFHKHGWFDNDRTTYKQSNQQHKMSVFTKDDDDSDVFSPQTCGHSNENHPNIALIHRNTGSQSNRHVLYPPKPGVPVRAVLAGPSSRERIQGFFRDRRVEAEHRDEGKLSAPAGLQTESRSSISVV